MQNMLLSKINVKKGKIIHFCEIAFTFCRGILTIKSFHRRNFGFRTGNFSFHRENLNFRTGNFFHEISFKYNELRFLNTIIGLITLTGRVPNKWHRLIFYFIFTLHNGQQVIVLYNHKALLAFK
ncbi:hypothetical protein GDA03_12515 [Salmonella enterica subsp. enterica]|nr:hypothetical protein [Salmonella enterica subsp. enterica]